MLGTTKIYGCLADPIDHVKAPSIFTSIFQIKQIDGLVNRHGAVLCAVTKNSRVGIITAYGDLQA